MGVLNSPIKLHGAAPPYYTLEMLQNLTLLMASIMSPGGGAPHLMGMGLRQTAGALRVLSEAPLGHEGLGEHPRVPWLHPGPLPRELSVCVCGLCRMQRIWIPELVVTTCVQ